MQLKDYGTGLESWKHPLSYFAFEVFGLTGVSPRVNSLPMLKALVCTKYDRQRMLRAS